MISKTSSSPQWPSHCPIWTLEDWKRVLSAFKVQESPKEGLILVGTEASTEGQVLWAGVEPWPYCRGVASCQNSWKVDPEWILPHLRTAVRDLLILFHATFILGQQKSNQRQRGKINGKARTGLWTETVCITSQKPYRSTSLPIKLTFPYEALGINYLSKFPAYITILLLSYSESIRAQLLATHFYGETF